MISRDKRTCAFLALGLSLRVWAQQPGSWADAQLRSAEDLIRRQDLPGAAQVLEAVIGARPACRSKVYFALARVRLRLGDENSGLHTAELGLAAHPRSLPLLKLAGQILFRQDPSGRRAGDLFRKATELDAKDAEAHFLYGEWACANNLDEVCIVELKQAAASPASGDQARMQIYTFIAMAEDRLNRPARADTAFRKALEFNRALHPPSPDSLLEYIRFLEKQSREGEAQALLKQLLEWAPEYGPAYLERAKHFSQLGELERAAEDAEAALRLAGENRQGQRAARLFLVKTYHALGREQQAEAHAAALPPE